MSIRERFEAWFPTAEWANEYDLAWAAWQAATQGVAGRDEYSCNEDTHYWPERFAKDPTPPPGTPCLCGEAVWKGALPQATHSRAAGLERGAVARALHCTNDDDTWQWGQWTTDEYGEAYYRNWADRFLAALEGGK